MADLIDRQAAIDELMKRDKALRNINWYDKPFAEGECKGIDDALEIINALPYAQPERLTDDDFETIRIHLQAYKERLGNQHRWEEAEEYQRIIDRFMRFASAQSERKPGKWIYGENLGNGQDGYFCDRCGHFVAVNYDFPINSEENKPTNFCPNCGARMEEGEQK